MFKLLSVSCCSTSFKPGIKLIVHELLGFALSLFGTECNFDAVILIFRTSIHKVEFCVAVASSTFKILLCDILTNSLQGEHTRLVEREVCYTCTIWYHCNSKELTLKSFQHKLSRIHDIIHEVFAAY